jgi:hypothetical protein
LITLFPFIVLVPWVTYIADNSCWHVYKEFAVARLHWTWGFMFWRRWLWSLMTYYLGCDTLSMFCLSLIWWILQSWLWSQYVSPKLQETFIRLGAIAFHKTVTIKSDLFHDNLKNVT